MVSLHFRCANTDCLRDFVLELPDRQDEAEGFSCSDCGARVLLMRFERIGSVAVQEAMDDLERRLGAVEERLAEATATDDDPFAPPDRH